MKNPIGMKKTKPETEAENLGQEDKESKRTHGPPQNNSGLVNDQPIKKKQKKQKKFAVPQGIWFLSNQSRARLSHPTEG